MVSAWWPATSGPAEEPWGMQSSTSGRQGGDPGDCPSWGAMVRAVHQGACAITGWKCGDSLLSSACGGERLVAGSVRTLILAGLTVLLASALVYRLIQRLQSRRRGSAVVAAAAAALAELRQKAPNLYPPVLHAWYKLPPGSTREPLLCAVCFQRVNPDATIMGSQVRCCEVCGLLVHDSGCLRLASPSCRPLAVQAARPPHHWRPAACRLPDPDEEGITEAGLGQLAPCIFCRRPCVTDFTSPEMVWDCSTCRCSCHVTCHLQAHESWKSSGEAAIECGTLKGTGKGPGSPQVELEAVSTATRPAGLQNGNVDDENSCTGLSHKARNMLVTPGAVRRSFSSSPKKIPRQVLREGSGAANGKKRKAKRRSSSVDLNPGEAGRREEAGLGPHMRRTSSAADLQALDTCNPGKLGSLVVPATCVRAKSEETWTGRARELVRQMAARAGKGARSRRRRNDASRTSGDPETTDGSLPQTPAGTSQGKRGGWGGWGEGRAVWQAYQLLLPLPPACKPLLVFINTRSGPQTGLDLRRRFLRRLHPLQVVEMPREDPNQALRMFARVADLRILVVGGDGTVGWLLSCLDTLAEELRRGGTGSPGDPGPRDLHWRPPPVAVLPMGTGNDLARVLRWGGGLHLLQERGLAGLLHDIQHAVIAFLDRWEVSITPDPASAPRRPLALTPSRPPSRTTTKKAMNNYLGVGVDAKVALDFHALREAYPHWFRSQMGNKLWYTTLGAGDILGSRFQSSRNLCQRIQLECDGVPVPLPEDVEGIVISNINSYMGGVNLWDSGHDEPGQLQAGSQALPLWEPAPSYVKQSCCDGILEVVGVGGSFHLGQLQVGLSRALRICQCRTARIRLLGPTPLQVDGEPWLQAAAVVEVKAKGQAVMLQRIESEPQARLLQAVHEALLQAERKALISPSQRFALTAELAAQLHGAL